MNGILKFCLALLIMAPSFGSIGLQQTRDFGENPGNLKMFHFSPKSAKDKSPLVVILHGCAQATNDFDDESGWNKLSREEGFHLLLPQQREENNDWRCFNWYSPSDFKRGQGEAQSIISMIEKMVKDKGVDRSRIYITGLSAGAAMVNSMLTNYPDYFNAGAIVAGIPYGCSSNSFDAWTCMYAMEFPPKSALRLGQAILNDSPPNTKKFPSVLVIHGTSDQFVSYKNAIRTVGQWTYVHGVSETENFVDEEKNYNVKHYTRDGKSVVALLTIPGLKHGYPIDPTNGCGEVGKFLIDAGICITEKIGTFFNLRN